MNNVYIFVISQNFFFGEIYAILELHFGQPTPMTKCGNSKAIEVVLFLQDLLDNK